MVATLVPTRSAFPDTPFPEVLADVHARADLAYPDAVLPLARLRMTEAGTVEAPGVGTLALTEWSIAQLARLLGCRWSRWFDAALVAPAERADEVNRRLMRHPAEMKVRSRRHAPGEAGEGDGVLRAFVGARYTPLDDVRVFDRLARVLGPRIESFRVVRATLTDRSSQYVAVTAEDVDLSGNGVPDRHRPGFLVANSEVGARALVLVEYLFRLVCTNGLVIALGGRRLFHRVHRATTDESLDRDLAYAVALLPDRWAAGAAAVRASRRHLVEEPEATLRQLLADSPDARPHTDRVLAAYRQEPEATRFGLVQAVTRAAQEVAPDDRLSLETLAGRLLATEALEAAA